MADNVAITAGSGTTMGADEVTDGTLGTVKVAYGKIMDGTLNSTNKLTISSGGAALVDGSATIQPVSGTVDTELPAAATLSDADAAAPSVPTVGAYNMIANAGATAATRMRGAGNGLNSTGTGLAAAQVIGQFDDVAPTSITENSFGNLRMSANRNLYGTIRDAAGNERGANVSAGNALLVDGSATTQPVSLAGTQSVNVAQINGVTTTMGNGVSGTGVQRVTLASDSTGQVALAAGAATIGALTANQSVNIAQMNGVTTAMGVGASSTGTQRVVIANDAGKTIVSKGGSAASNGNNTLVTAGTNRLKVHAFSLTTTSTTAMTCIFQDGASGTELWRVIIQAVTGASTGANLSIQPPAWLFATSAATLLNLNLSSANAVHWSLSYVDEA